MAGRKSFCSVAISVHPLKPEWLSMSIGKVAAKLSSAVSSIREGQVKWDPIDSLTDVAWCVIVAR
jgi:hypothetical protein